MSSLVLFFLFFQSVHSFVVLPHHFDVDYGKCNTTLNAPGTITSPSYPSSYPLSTSCVYKLVAPSGSRILCSEGFCDYFCTTFVTMSCAEERRMELICVMWIRLTFTYLDTESCCDNIDVFDGGDTSAPRIKRLSGHMGTNCPNLVSTSNLMTVRFYSDLTVTYKGFTADFIAF